MAYPYFIQNNKIHVYGTNKQLGFIQNSKIHVYGTNKQIGEVKNIKNKIKDSNSVDDAHIVAAYHFLIKSIF